MMVRIFLLLVAPPVSNPNVVPGFGTNKPNPSSTSSLDTLASIESSYVHLHKLKYLSAWRNLQANVPSFFFGALISEVIEWSSLRIRRGAKPVGAMGARAPPIILQFTL